MPLNLDDNKRPYFKQLNLDETFDEIQNAINTIEGSVPNENVLNGLNNTFYGGSTENPYATQQQIDNLRDSGVFAKTGAPGSIGGFSIPISGDFSAAIYIDNIDNDVFTASSNPQGNILTFSTSGAPYSIPLNFFYQSYGWLNISYEYSTNTLRLYYPYGGGVSNTITPPLQLAALTNITNSFENGYIRKAYAWTNQLFDDGDFYYLNRNDGVLDSNLFIGPKKPKARWEPNSIAFNGVSNIWYDTSGNGYDAVVLGFMVNPKPWVSLSNLQTILPNYLEKSGGIMTGNLTVGDNILGANNITGENMVVQFDNLFLTTPNTTFQFPNLDGANRNVLMTDGSGGLSFSNILISDVNNLQTTLNGKSNVGHTHSISDVINLQSQLDGKVNNPLYVTATTTTNVLTPLFTTTIPLNTSRTIRYHLKGRDGAGNTFAAECWYSCRNIANTTTLVGTVTIDRKSNFNNAVQTSITFSGANTTINITPNAGVTTVWELYVREIF